VGAWPLQGWGSEPDFGERIAAYMTKARHEAKLHTSYINPDVHYEQAAEAFVAAVLDRSKNPTFLGEVETFVADIMRAGVCNSLAQLVLKIAAPGLPDFFQGRELWDFSLVDPDNRRPIDFAPRPAWLAQVTAAAEAGGAGAVEQWFDHPADGFIKLWITAAGLRLRQRRAALFRQGGYLPLSCEGPAAQHVFAFARHWKDEVALVAVGRHLARMGASPVGEVWQDTVVLLPSSLPSVHVRDVFTGRQPVTAEQRLPLDAVFRSLPVSLMEAT